MRRFPVSMLFLAVPFLVLACESDDGGTTATPDPNEGRSFQQAIVAAEGGVLATPGDTATLTVPAGALSADTTLTVKVEAPTGAARAGVYDFGPDGTQFQVPVTLAIAFDGTVPRDKKAVLAWLDGSDWTEVPGSSLAGGKVSGAVDHFTRFTIIFIDDKAFVVGECGDLVDDFAPCGGSVLGRWSFDTVCIPPQEVGDNPFADWCPDARVEADLDWNGTIEFDGTSATQKFDSQTWTLRYEIPVSCLQVPEQCQALADEEGTTCAISGALCKCTTVQTEQGGEPSVRPYSVQGNDLVVGDDDPTPYCVQGDTLIVEVADVNEETAEITYVYPVLKRQ